MQQPLILITPWLETQSFMINLWFQEDKLWIRKRTPNNPKNLLMKEILKENMSTMIWPDHSMENH
jgi:hypothetical protein